MDIPASLAALAGAVAAFVTGGFAYLATRSKAKVDVGQALTDGFTKLTDQLQEERQSLNQQNTDLRLKVETQSAWIKRLESHISIVEWHAHTLESLMVAQGMTPPVMRMDFIPSEGRRAHGPAE